MPKTIVKIGPSDHGHPMSLDEFDEAEVQEGYIYELSRGIITVSDVPNTKHLAMVLEARRQLSRYDLAHPGVIFGIITGSECKILLGGFESERHPDLAVYKTSPPDERNVWATWVPELVIEVVSASSRHRDYEEKPAEYLQFGISEYWIIDGEKKKMVVHNRMRGQWSERTLKPPRIYKPALLPGLEFSCKRVFNAAESMGEKGKQPSKRANKNGAADGSTAP
jgi:Uma2 family endonuclease